MRAKINREGNRLDITIKGNTFTKYINKCILCGKETIDDIDRGARHICDNCYKEFESVKTETANNYRKRVIKSVDKKEVKIGFEDGSRAVSKYNTIMSSSRGYKPSIEIVGLVNYKNLLARYGTKINDRVMTLIVELIIKGINTSNKMANHLGITSQKTINSLRTYLRRMERVGMVTKTKRRPNESIHDNIFSLDRRLVYTQC